jgi:hypothetical protein
VSSTSLPTAGPYQEQTRNRRGRGLAVWHNAVTKMPFTISHAATVVPIRPFGVFSALLVGSFIPDLPYFIPKLSRNHFAHSLPNLFLFCLPMGFLCLWIFQRFLREPLATLLPVSHQVRLGANEFKFLPLRRLAHIVLSILMGASSHIVWDSFTHQSGWAVQNWDALRKQVTIANHSIQMSDLVQHISTVTGLTLLAFWYTLWLRSTPPTGPDCRSYGSSESTAGLVLFLLAGAVWPAFFLSLANRWYLKHARTDVSALAVKIGIKLLFLELIGFCTLWHLRRKCNDDVRRQRSLPTFT